MAATRAYLALTQLWIGPLLESKAPVLYWNPWLVSGCWDTI